MELVEQGKSLSGDGLSGEGLSGKGQQAQVKVGLGRGGSVGETSPGTQSIRTNEQRSMRATANEVDWRPASEPTELGQVQRSDRWFRSALFRQLRGLKTGHLTIVDADGQHCFGDGSGDIPPVTLQVIRPSAYRRIVTGGDLGFSESLMEGDFSIDRLVPLLRMLVINSRFQAPTFGQQPWLRWLRSKVRHWLKRNHRSNASRNIRAHYDLSNEFFGLWLDPTMTYSSGVFPSLHAAAGASGPEWQSNDSMEAASIEKIDLLCQKLDLQPEDHLVEIGCGWGGLAIHAASRYGCRVTGVTLSPAQLEIAQQRVAAAGLQDRVTLQLMDYRDLTGQYDKLVSVEMIEAVGFEFHDEYFRTCCRLLKPEGRMAFQGITILDQRYAHYLSQIDFIREYIFPGGCLISNAEVLRSVTRASDFRLVDTQEIGLHYAETLRRWRTEFHRHWDAITRLGFDERFFRLWDYYLAYCEAGFSEGHVGTVQMVLDRPACIAPVVRQRQPGSGKSADVAASNGKRSGTSSVSNRSVVGPSATRPHLGSTTMENPSSLAGH